MKNKPILNAVLAAFYIVLVSSGMFYGSNYVGSDDTVLAPITMLSLFTLSAAVMGYLFLGGPIQLYLDGKKKEGVALFFQTLGAFAVITLLIFVTFIVF